jgi:hypothetical protein
MRCQALQTRKRPRQLLALAISDDHEVRCRRLPPEVSQQRGKRFAGDDGRLTVGQLVDRQCDRKNRSGVQIVLERVNGQAGGQRLQQDVLTQVVAKPAPARSPGDRRSR